MSSVTEIMPEDSLREWMVITRYRAMKIKRPGFPDECSLSLFPRCALSSAHRRTRIDVRVNNLFTRERVYARRDHVEERKYGLRERLRARPRRTWRLTSRRINRPSLVHILSPPFSPSCSLGHASTLTISTLPAR